ncbi:MAG TPA: type II secretion system F family protein [Micropepsaceae bacterium]|jgi:tight adherence protein B
MSVTGTIVAFSCVAFSGLLLARLAAARSRLSDLRRLDTVLAAAPHMAQDTKSESRLPPFVSGILARAGWEPTRRQIVTGAAAMLLLALTAMIASGPLAAISSALTSVLLGFAFLEYRAAARIRLLAQSMLGFLERIRQLLSVGNSLAVALDRAVENSPPIVGQCLTPTLRRIANGSGVAESLERCAAELDLYELHLLATATRTNLRFGGSMSAILRNIIDNIRKRTSIERELRANTTQIRASAWVLALLPLLVATLVMVTNRDYARWFLSTEKGHGMILYAVASQILGVACMQFVTRTRY